MGPRHRELPWNYDRERGGLGAGIGEPFSNRTWHEWNKQASSSGSLKARHSPNSSLYTYIAAHTSLYSEYNRAACRGISGGRAPAHNGPPVDRNNISIYEIKISNFTIFRMAIWSILAPPTGPVGVLSGYRSSPHRRPTGHVQPPETPRGG